jgi:hypothetical protein
MGAILASYFEKAKAAGGLAAAVKLAMMTKMSQVAATQAPDSVENTKMFEEALKKIG